MEKVSEDAVLARAVDILLGIKAVGTRPELAVAESVAAASRQSVTNATSQ